MDGGVCVHAFTVVQLRPAVLDANVHVHHGPDVCVVSEQEDGKLNRRQNKDGGFDWMIKATARDQRVNWKSEQFQDLKLILSDLSLRNRVT